MSYLNYDNLVVVNDDADLPAPVAGKITLASGYTYVIRGMITVADTIVIGSNCAMVGFDRFTDFINYTGSGDMFAYSGSGSIKFEELGFICTNGRVFNISGNTNETFVITNCYIASCAKVGLINDIRTTVFRSFSVVAASDPTTPGLQFTGTCTSFNMDNSLWQGFATGTTAIDFGAVIFDRIQVSTGNRFDIGTGAKGISGLINSGNISSGGGGVISNSIFEGAGTYLNNINPNDLRWEVFGNKGISSTSYNGYITLVNNATNTVISAANTPVLLTATTWADQITARFTMLTSGRLTYIGLDDKVFNINARVSIEPVSGTNVTISSYIALNGTPLAYTQASARASNGSPASITMISEVELSTNDYIEIFVENNDNSTDLLITASAITAKG